MRGGWHIQGHYGLTLIFDGWASAQLSERQIKQLLARLHCRDLTEEETIAAMEASEDHDRIDRLVRPNAGAPGGGYITRGVPHYTAVFEKRPADLRRRCGVADSV